MKDSKVEVWKKERKNWNFGLFWVFEN